VPSLDLRFADNKSLVDATTGAQLVTFTRASTGTFVGSNGLIQTAATNEPRFDHNPTTGESLGLLVEEARTNLCLQSEDFSTTWTKVAATVTADAIVSPSGALNADKLVETTANSTHYAVQTVSVTTTSRTASVYLKAGERTLVRIEHSGNTGGAARRITINLSTGAITGAITIGTGGLNSFSESIVSVGNGWYRVISTIDPTVTSGNTQALLIQILDNTGQATYVGDGTSGIYIWGAQLEAGAFPTSYIPTTTATVTRAADVASITGANFSSWYNQTEGTVFAETQLQSIAGRSATGFDINDNSTNNRIVFRALTISVSDQVVIRSGSSTVFSAAGVTPAPTTASRKSAVGYKVNDFIFTATGNAGFTGTTGAVPLSVNQMLIGYEQGPTGYMGGTIKRLTFWPTRLSNTVLQQITQP
jgi:hypothetical protein